MSNYARILLLLLFALPSLVAPTVSRADVVKPALIEITADTSGKVIIEIRASIEALLTGINARYKNTQEAPNAAEYDTLREMQPEELAKEFEPFKQTLLDLVELKADGVPVELHFADVDVAERGYTKVPRISVITLEGPLERSTKSLTWYYPERFGDNAVRVRQIDNDKVEWHWSEWQWLRKDKASEAFSLEELFTKRPTSEVVISYIITGFDHIIPKGLDHILFILGIFLFSTKMRPLLEQVTMFTVAHTITLGLSMLGIISLPARIVEPLIALSIAYVGIENVFSRSLHKSRLLLVFGFGLLHGMGFASVLGDFGMPKDAFATALISFNVGVELGQLTVISLAYFGVAFWLRNKPEVYRRWVVIPCSLAISIVALYWTFDRLELF